MSADIDRDDVRNLVDEPVQSLADYDDDGWQEHKDGVAMGYINEDGSQREPDEPDWADEP
jgi:hypothetical protein